MRSPVRGSKSSSYCSRSRFLLFPIVSFLLASTQEALSQTFGPVNVDIGSSDAGSSEDVGWSDGVCYRPLANLRPGDTLTFSYGAHDVYKMSTADHLANCDFADAILLAGVGDSPFVYTITEQDALNSEADGGLHFACSVGAHCSSGMQRLTARVANPAAIELVEERKLLPACEYIIGVGEGECSMYQSGVEVESGTFLQDNALRSECSEPELGDDGRYHVSCLSGPATLTPGGVMNSARYVHDDAH